jgi:hypothetical protein
MAGERYFELNGTQGPKPILVLVTGVAKEQARIDRIRSVYLTRRAHSVVEHHEFDDVGFEQIEGYEHYGALARNIHKHGLDNFCDFLADLQVWGSPQQVTEKLLDLVELVDAGGLIIPLCFGGIPHGEAQESFDLFTSEVLPEIKRHDVGGDLGVPYAATPAAV